MLHEQVRSKLEAKEVVELLKPYRKDLISDALSEEDFRAFVRAVFDANHDGAIDLSELKAGIYQVSSAKKALMTCFL